MSIRAKLISLILIFILPIVGLMVIFHTRMVSAYQEQSLVFENSAARMVSGVIKEQINEARNAMYTTGRDGERLLNPFECQKSLDRLTSTDQFFHSTMVADEEGKILCSSKNFDFNQSVASLPAFQEVIKLDDFILGDFPGGEPGSNSKLIMAYPIHNRVGEPAGVLIGLFDLASLESSVEESRLLDGTEIYVFTKNGLPLYSPAFVDEPTKRELSKIAVSHSIEQNSSAQYFTIKGFDNIERVFRFMALDLGKTVLVAVGFPEGKFISDSEQFITGNIAVISLLTLAVLILIFGGLEGSLIKPLEKISQTADLLAKGDFTARTNLGIQKDEIGKLGYIFDKMAESLEENLATLEEETSAKLASQEKFFRLFEDSVLGIFQIDRENRLIEVNSSLARMFGYSSDEEMIKEVNGPAKDLFFNESDNKKIASMIEQRQPGKIETQFRKRDGTVFDGNLHVWGVWNASGELETLEGFVEDITEAMKTQNQLNQLIQAVEQNPIGIMISDGKGKIEYANHGIFNVFGYEPAEILGKPLLSLVPDTVTEEEIDQIRRTIIDGKMYRGEIKNTKKNGGQFWERFVASPITNLRDKTTNTLCLIEDITEQNSNKERIVKQVEELSALRTIDLAISSNLDLLATLNIIANLAVKHLGVDAVCIQLYDSQFHMLQSAVQYGLDNFPSENIPFPAAADLSDWELVEEFSIHIPEDLDKKIKTHRVSYPEVAQFSACFGLPLVAKAEVKGLFRVFLKDPFHPVQHWLDFFYNLATQTAVALDNYELFRNLKQSNIDLLQAYEATIEGWSKALNYRDAETEDHSIRTTKWTIELAREMGYPTEELVHIRRGALLHDIGKVAVPDSILNKPGPLTDDEWIQMRKHPLAAHEVLAPIEFLNKSLDIPYCHHERWDGTGYPRGLKGQEIPLAARIFSVIDVYDALTTDRPYRSAWPTEKVIHYLREQSGIQFDPAIVEAFLILLDKQKLI